MNIKKRLLLGLLALSLVGCTDGTQNQSNDILREENETLQEEINRLELEIEVLEIKNAEITEKLNSILETNKNESNITETPNATKNIEISLYDRDINSWEIVEIGKIDVPRGTSTVDILNKMASELSKIRFNDYIIEVTNIEDIDGIKVATIDLKDDTKNNKIWHNTHFQGSSGAKSTIDSIVNSFLQKDMNTTWPEELEEDKISGVRLLYNGEEYVSDHVTLEGILY